MRRQRSFDRLRPFRYGIRRPEGLGLLAGLP